ncbi:MAG: ankyrin repeat domain-containing protein [Capsulimonadaceae bacterium]|nr:ankyrin repeat domain-containing protein [Capsulimonadaceae bacterium]
MTTPASPQPALRSRATLLATLLCLLLGLGWAYVSWRVHSRQFDSPLHRACFSGDLSTVRHLVDAGADVNLQGERNGRDTPLMLAIAAEENRGAIVKLLIDHGANVRLADNKGRTALHLAALYGDLPLATLLLAHGADVNARDAEGHTSLSYAGVWTKDKPMRDLLLGHGGRIGR